MLTLLRTPLVLVQTQTNTGIIQTTLTSRIGSIEQKPYNGSVLLIYCMGDNQHDEHIEDEEAIGEVRHIEDSDDDFVETYDEGDNDHSE